jgi:hypothetical protein
VEQGIKRENMKTEISKVKAREADSRECRAAAGDREAGSPEPEQGSHKAAGEAEPERVQPMKIPDIPEVKAKRLDVHPEKEKKRNMKGFMTLIALEERTPRIW